MWGWIWPHVGANPINHGLDTEMFDRQDYPYSDTFVREAIQNTLDARAENAVGPVTIRFRFHSGAVEPRAPYLSQVIALRKKAGLTLLPELKTKPMTWITIEDFNTRGLQGDLKKRTSDFWGYWLNFGLSNKDGTGRGGRGIGRVTFLIASQIHTVLGYTRRQDDGSVAACGMCVLKPTMDGDNMHSTHAYLASEENNSIYELHESKEFQNGMLSAFNLEGYHNDNNRSGLALVIPWPHEELVPEGIFASTIEHFSPAILNGSLVVEVDGRTLDSATIYNIAPEVAPKLKTDALKHDPVRYFNLIKQGIEEEGLLLNLAELDLSILKEDLLIKDIRKQLNKGDAITLRLEFPLKHKRKQLTAKLKAVVALTPSDSIPIDRLFREGMSLPDVKTKIPGMHDLFLLVSDHPLATYLNFCEGKAHLSLEESKDVKEKLELQGFDDGIRIKRFVAKLPTELRALLTHDITEPDATVFDSFFFLPKDEDGTGSGRRKKEPNAVENLPPPRIPAFKVQTLEDGFRIVANKEYLDWPVNLQVGMAYASGSSKLDWRPSDFHPSDLETIIDGCEARFLDTPHETKKGGLKLRAEKCSSECSIEVRGFDSNRELDTQLRVWHDAQEN